MPDAKKHSDNTVIMGQPIVLALNLEIGHCILHKIFSMADCVYGKVQDAKVGETV